MGLIYYIDIEDLDLSIKYLEKSLIAGFEIGYPNYYIAMNYWYEDINYEEAEEQFKIAVNSSSLSDEDMDAYYRLGW